MDISETLAQEIKKHDNVYSFMKGGLHTENKPDVFEEDEDHEIIDWDVASYYPAIIINSEKYLLGEIALLEGEDYILLDRLAKVIIGQSNTLEFLSTIMGKIITVIPKFEVI